MPPPALQDGKTQISEALTKPLCSSVPSVRILFSPQSTERHRDPFGLSLERRLKLDLHPRHEAIRLDGQNRFRAPRRDGEFQARARQQPLQ